MSPLLTARGLTGLLTDSDTVALIASYGGRVRNPDWYSNLVANPHVEIQIDGERQTMQARTASAEERPAWWPRIVEAYKGYREYQERTDREIPVVLLQG